MDERLERLGSNIKRTRKHKGISQEMLANLADVERSYMGFIERGKKNITVLTLYKIADALETEVAELLE